MTVPKKTHELHEVRGLAQISYPAHRIDAPVFQQLAATRRAMRKSLHSSESYPRTELPRLISTRNVAWMGRHGSVFHQLAGPIPTKVAPLAGAAMFE